MKESVDLATGFEQFKTFGEVRLIDIPLKHLVESDEPTSLVVLVTEDISVQFFNADPYEYAVIWLHDTPVVVEHGIINRYEWLGRLICDSEFLWYIRSIGYQSLES